MNPQFRITNVTVGSLTRIERARGFLDAAKLSAEWIAGMQQRALVLEAHHTTRIEGTHLTLDQSQRLLATAWLATPENLRQTGDTTCDKLAPVLATILG
jgi:Fic family protein